MAAVAGDVIHVLDNRTCLYLQQLTVICWCVRVRILCSLINIRVRLQQGGLTSVYRCFCGKKLQEYSKLTSDNEDQ